MTLFRRAGVRALALSFVLLFLTQFASADTAPPANGYGAVVLQCSDGTTAVTASPTNGCPVASAQVVAITAAIPDGAAITGVIDLTKGRFGRIVIPSQWATATSITFQTCLDAAGTSCNNLYDPSGNEYTVTVAASRSVLVTYADFFTVRYLKIRSGTSGAPVNQTGVTLTLALAP